MKKSIAERFWLKVASASTGCHQWTACKNRFGYGKISDGKNKWMLAHRWAWESKNGPIPEGKLLLHTCDNPSCVNVEHLYLGSYKDNAQDRETRGRSNHAFGHRHGKAKLIASYVLEIRDLFDTGRYSFRQLGKIYGVDGKCVADIVDRKIWAHVA